MGQKVHPKGLRLGINANWSSRWFFSDEKKYRETLLADLKIRQSLMAKLAHTAVTQVDIERAINKITVIIYSVKPGMIIGRGGKGLEEVKKYVLQNLPLDKQGKDLKIDLKIEPVKKPYLNAYYTAQTIAEKLVKGFPHRSTVHNAMNRVIEAGAKGVKVQLGGRIAARKFPAEKNIFKAQFLPLPLEKMLILPNMQL
jgi:small subunit ribosomal protein S3